MNKSWLNKIPFFMGWYLAGFADGEGSFNVSIRKKDYSIGWQISSTFNVSQKDSKILSLFKRWLGCGIIRQRKDGIFYYEVNNLNSLKERVIPFFDKYYFLSSEKKRNFRIFKEIVIMMYEKKHLTPEGFNKILQLREELNKGRGRKRKYNIEDVLKN
jgi:hypothetical protein